MKVKKIVTDVNEGVDDGHVVDPFLVHCACDLNYCTRDLEELDLSYPVVLTISSASILMLVRMAGLDQLVGDAAVATFGDGAT